MLGFSASDTERSLRKQFPLLASASCTGHWTGRSR